MPNAPSPTNSEPAKAGHSALAPRRAMRMAGAWAAAALCAVMGLGLAAHHPLAPWMAPVLFLLAAAAAVRWPLAWPLALPALLPCIGLAPWTGWLTFEEWDLLVLAIAAGGYLRRAVWPLPGAAPRAGGGLSPVVAAVLLLYAAALLISLAHGIDAAGGWRFGWFQGYREPMNSVRLAKSLFAALLLYPLWRDAQRADPTRCNQHLATGMALGLLATALAATWERLAFTDLLNFSADYRTTALFWEMHVGGAALDGMLALSFPFVVRELLGSEGSRRRWLLMAAIVSLAAYACLTTFSRGVYLAVPLGAAVMVAVHGAAGRHGPRQLRGSWRRWLAPALLLLPAFAWAAAAMFPSSGYRGLLALLGASMLLLALPGALRSQPRSTLVLGCVLGVLLAGLAWAIATLHPKGAYLAYAGVFLITAAAPLQQRRQPSSGPGIAALGLGGFIATLLCLGLVARHWGGPTALAAAAPALWGLPLLLLLALFLPRAPWPAAWRWQAGTATAMLLAAAVVAAFGGGAYMAGRFATSGADLDGRLHHWRQGLSLLRSPVDLLFGRGLGRYVDDHAFAAAANQVPGDYRLRQESGNRFLTLVAGTHELGWGELMRLSQRIASPQGPLVLQLSVRSEQAAIVHFDVCAKHLLYDGGCWVQQLRLPARPGQWQSARVQFDGEPLPTGPWYAPRLVMFSVAAESPGMRIDIDRLVLTDADGRNRLTNGDFEADLARWFMTSDRHHMPWHIKSMAAHVAFDQGLVGVLLLAVLVAGGLARLSLGPARHHPLAPAVAGGLTGFLVVGLFDSLLDVPRVAFLFYLLLLLALSLKPPPAAPPPA